MGELPSTASTDDGRSDDERLMDGVAKNGFTAHVDETRAMTSSSNDTSPGNSSDREAIYEMGIHHTFY